MAKEQIKIGVFYDGNYFLHVSNYYNYFHALRQRLSLPGFHRFICRLVEEAEDAPLGAARVMSAHYFRGRLSAQEANQRGNQLYNDRVFDDILMSMGISSHFLPLRTRNGKKEEKGIDVWLALEAYEQAIARKFDVLVLITSDGEYLPLVRKVNSLGLRTMVLNWEFTYQDDSGRTVVTRTSQDLLQEVCYPVSAHMVIDYGLDHGIGYVQELFLPVDDGARSSEVMDEVDEGHESQDEPRVNDSQESVEYEEYYRGTIMNIHIADGYGFIRFPPNNLFFHRVDVEDCEFSSLRDGDEVSFKIGQRSSTGQLIAKHVRPI